LLATGIVFGALDKSELSSYPSTVSGADSALSDARTFAAAADGFFAASVVAGCVTGYLLYRDLRTPDATMAAVAVPHGAALVVEGVLP
jgi:hypothetical protein